MKRAIISFTAAVVLIYAGTAAAQQITVYQPRVVWVPQQYNVQVQHEWRRAWLFPRLWRQRTRVIYTPVESSNDDTKGTTHRP